MFVCICTDSIHFAENKGKSHAVALFILATEDRQTFTKLMEFLKQHNPCENVKVIVTDKDFTDRSVLIEQFPWAPNVDLVKEDVDADFDRSTRWKLSSLNTVEEKFAEEDQ